MVSVVGSLRMTIPNEITKAFNLKADDHAVVTLDDSTILVEKKHRAP